VFLPIEVQRIDSAAIATHQQPSAPAQPPLASTMHTVGLLLILSGVAVLTYFSTGRMRVAEHPHRVRLYVTTMILEWLLTAYVLVGVRLHHTSLQEVTGAKWKNAKEFFRDLGIALAFWIGALFILALLGYLLKFKGNVRYLAPESTTETILWVAVSVTAGICEEAIFRGYLQKQFTAWTGNETVGLLLSAAAFGAGHAYQGAKATVILGAYGLMFGILAQQRKSLRPGMITHSLHDTVAGLAVRLLPK
jgi:membrane protease YdiL (CAAX protease family)